MNMKVKTTLFLMPSVPQAEAGKDGGLMPLCDDGGELEKYMKKTTAMEKVKRRGAAGEGRSVLKWSVLAPLGRC